MKPWIILISILAMVVTWYRINQNRPVSNLSFGQRCRLISRTLLAGVVVYFSLMSIALIYLMLSNQ
jgi:hypothetical protein